MNRPKLRRTVPAILLAVALLSCQLLTPEEIQPTLTAAPVSTPTVIASPTGAPPTGTPAPASPTETQGPPTATDSPPPTATTGPECVVLQSLNFRPGPGLAYRPPIRSLEAGTTLVPVGFNPVGVPGGSWVQVQILLENEIGWVSGGDQFVGCNIDLSTLPEVNVPPPPPPPPPSVDSSAPDGTVPPGWVWDDIFDPNFLVRMLVYDQGNSGVQDGDGMVSVGFQVLDSNGDLVWERTENTAAYCIFAGGEPNCNPWVIEDFLYRWGEGGPQVEEGPYTLLITAESAFGEFGNWNYDIEIDLPY